MSKIITWFNSNSAAVQAATTIILVILTATYVVLNRRIAKANKKIAQYMKEEFDLMNRPYIGIADYIGIHKSGSEYKFDFAFQNYGKTPGLITKITFLEYSTPEKYKSADFKKNTTLFPGQKIGIYSKADSAYCNGELGMKLYYEANSRTYEAEFILKYNFSTCKFEDFIKSTTT